MKLAGAFFYIIFSWLLAHSPRFILFGIADFIYFIVYRVIKYRKKVVLNNLRNSFPEKTEEEIRIIMKKFFRYFGDLVVENIAIPRMSKKRLLKIVNIKNPEVFTELYNQKKNLIGILGHYANWEMCMGISLYTKYQILSVYKPLNNKFFDKEFFNLRSRFGAIPVTMDDTYRVILDHRRKNKLFILGLISDQRPQKSSTNHWVKFLNQDTPVFFGPEKIAKKFNAVVFYTHVDKVKRGFYEVEFTILISDPLKCKENEITETHVKFLENKIIEKPELWLWSHKRWKYKRDNEES